MSTKIYEGTSTSSSNQIANIQGDRLSDEEFFTVLFLLAKMNNLI